jgi:nanoRNase/pAp phosphatase (c-di-AMP/oligoRNAs hydrolase)
MKPLADAFAGQGGGHPTAASVNLSATADEVTSETLSLVSSKLGLSEQDLKAIHTKK